MGEGLTERGVAVGSEVGRAVVRLVGGAVRRTAEDALAVRRRQLSVDVDRCKAGIARSKCQRSRGNDRKEGREEERNATLTSIDVGQVPGGALAAELGLPIHAVDVAGLHAEDVLREFLQVGIALGWRGWSVGEGLLGVRWGT